MPSSFIKDFKDKKCRDAVAMGIRSPGEATNAFAVDYIAEYYAKFGKWLPRQYYEVAGLLWWHSVNSSDLPRPLAHELFTHIQESGPELLRWFQVWLETQLGEEDTPTKTPSSLRMLHSMLISRIVEQIDHAICGNPEEHQRAMEIDLLSAINPLTDAALPLVDRIYKSSGILISLTPPNTQSVTAYNEYKAKTNPQRN